MGWSFRDGVELNGGSQGQRGSSEEALREVVATALEQARRILEESSQYNLGARRDVNLPTLALLWLLPENQRRLEFERKGERTIASLRGIEVVFARSRARRWCATGATSPLARQLLDRPDRELSVACPVRSSWTRGVAEQGLTSFSAPDPGGWHRASQNPQLIGKNRQLMRISGTFDHSADVGASA